MEKITGSNGISCHRKIRRRLGKVSKRTRRNTGEMKGFSISPTEAGYLEDQLKYLRSSLAYTTDLNERKRICGEIEELKKTIRLASLY